SSGTFEFLLIGGGSLILLAVLGFLRNPLFVMNDGARALLQQSGTTTLTFIVLLSYPHFFFSYKFAYEQGWSFIKRHSLQLLWFPLFML
ncbi:hypothetical protein ACSTKO_24260, partial [Vibrio parahaemolyticus]